jgi:hypothetical protein
MMTWNDFKPQLFEKMEERRARQSMFHTEQIYSFILGCAKQFNVAKKTEAQQAMNKIQDEGTFLLVADSFSEFRAMFPEIDGQQWEPAAPGQRRDVAASPQPHEQQVDDGAHHNRQGAPARSQAPTDARRGSGQPFRR